MKFQIILKMFSLMRFAGGVAKHALFLNKLASLSEN